MGEKRLGQKKEGIFIQVSLKIQADITPRDIHRNFPNKDKISKADKI